MLIVPGALETRARSRYRRFSLVTTVRAHVIVSGRVQGVFYRYATSQRATELRVSGWVRNLADGRVEAVFEGARDAVGSLIAWCREGPPYAKVADVDVVWETPSGERGFVVR